jgi:hypothetical protein
VSRRSAGQKLGVERLLAMRTDDGTLVAGGGLGHRRSVPSRQTSKNMRANGFRSSALIHCQGGYTAR